MNRNIIKGKEGEDLACAYLKDQGYEVIARNYRYKRGEIDLIVKKEELLIFVEVKFRSGLAFGYPEQAVNWKKAAKVMATANHFIYEVGWERDIRFDIVAVSSDQVVDHFVDAFS